MPRTWRSSEPTCFLEKEKRAHIFAASELHNARKSQERVSSVHVGLVRFIIPSGDTPYSDSGPRNMEECGRMHERWGGGSLHSLNGMQGLFHTGLSMLTSEHRNDVLRTSEFIAAARDDAEHSRSC